MPKSGAGSLLEERTSLTGTRVDVSSRAGWLLRMARSRGARPDASISLRELSRRLGTSVTRLHRAEVGQLRDGDLVTDYERALGLPSESLRAPIDTLARTFPADAAPDLAVARSRIPDLAGARRDVRLVSGLTELLTDSGSHATGGDWGLWARLLAPPAALGLPVPLAEAALDRLVGELNRAAGTAYPSRYEALATMRCSPYGDLLVGVARARVNDADVQVMEDMMSAVGELDTPDAVAWCLDLLSDPRDSVAQAGAIGIENLAAITGRIDFWAGLAPRLVAALNSTKVGSPRHAWLSHTYRLMPARVAPRGPDGVTLAPAARIPNWSRSRANRHWAECEVRAARACQQVGLPPQPILAGLMFDAAISPYETRSTTSLMLLTALPEIAQRVLDELVTMAAETDDEVLHARLCNRLGGSRLGHQPKRDIMPSDTPPLTRAMWRLSGWGGRTPSGDNVEAALNAGGENARSALFGIGLTNNALAAKIAKRTTLPNETRQAARWWTRAGTRVLH